MSLPVIFLGSSSEQSALVDLLTLGLGRSARIEPWQRVTQPGVMTLEALTKKAREVDFALFIFGPDDVTESRTLSQDTPRDNVVFEAGLFGGILGVERTIILHAKRVKIPSDLLGLTCIRYDSDAPVEGEMNVACATMRADVLKRGRRGAEGTAALVTGLWWQYSIGGGKQEKSSVAFIRLTCDSSGDVTLNGRAWDKDGLVLARFWSRATKVSAEPPGLFYYWEGEWPTTEGVPKFYGTGEVNLQSSDRASGYFTTRSDSDVELNVLKPCEYFRAAPDDEKVIFGSDAEKRITLLRRRLQECEAAAKH